LACRVGDTKGEAGARLRWERDDQVRLGLTRVDARDARYGEAKRLGSLWMEGRDPDNGRGVAARELRVSMLNALRREEEVGMR